MGVKQAAEEGTRDDARSWIHRGRKIFRYFLGMQYMETASGIRFNYKQAGFQPVIHILLSQSEHENRRFWNLTIALSIHKSFESCH